MVAMKTKCAFFNNKIKGNEELILVILTLSPLKSYTDGAPSKARNFNIVYIWTYIWQR